MTTQSSALSLTALTTESDDIATRLYQRMVPLFPICRSLTGDGVRRTLEYLQREVPLTIHEVPSGTAAFDWTVPLEWNVRAAWIANSRGERVVDFAASNLHLVSYSRPFRGRLSLEELRPHLHSLPDQPALIPYRTGYYRDDWGFCLSHAQLMALADDTYDVCVDTTLRQGALTYGEVFLPGTTGHEVLVSCHVCHPSLCNDNLSGITVAVELARALADRPRRFSYRFLFVPATIGPIAWLSRHRSAAAMVAHGVVLAGVGDRGEPTYKRSRRGNAPIDRAFAQVLNRRSPERHRLVDFSPYGYDERQYCSPGFNLPVGRFSRSEFGTYPEYHTSADNLSFVSASALYDSFQICRDVFDLLERDRRYVNTNPMCEPQLGRRGLYRSLAGQAHGRDTELALLWVLNQSDGTHSLLDIADRSGLSFETIAAAAALLADHNLVTLKRTEGSEKVGA